MLQPCFHPVIDSPVTARKLVQLAGLFLHCDSPLAAMVQVLYMTTLSQLIHGMFTL